jgi:hypothetical protein
MFVGGGIGMFGLRTECQYVSLMGDWADKRRSMGGDEPTTMTKGHTRVCQTLVPTAVPQVQR